MGLRMSVGIDIDRESTAVIMCCSISLIDFSWCVSRIEPLVRCTSPERIASGVGAGHRRGSFEASALISIQHCLQISSSSSSESELRAGGFGRGEKGPEGKGLVGLSERGSEMFCRGAKEIRGAMKDPDFFSSFSKSEHIVRMNAF